MSSKKVRFSFIVNSYLFYFDSTKIKTESIVSFSKEVCLRRKNFQEQLSSLFRKIEKGILVDFLMERGFSTHTLPGHKERGFLFGGMMMLNKKLKDLYENDAYDWYFKNASLIREKRFDEIDFENVAEELESMGRGEERELQSYLTQLFLHILKWKYQPERRSPSWEISIKKQRRHVRKLLLKNPSLNGHLQEIIDDSYTDARYDTASETGIKLEKFPEQKPFLFEETLQDDWLPD